MRGCVLRAPFSDLPPALAGKTRSINALFEHRLIPLDSIVAQNGEVNGSVPRSKV